MELLCSTGAFSREPDYVDHQSILACCSELEVDGFEVIFYSAWYEDIERTARDLRRFGLRFAAVHAEKSIATDLGATETQERERGVDKLEINCRFGSQIGAKSVILHLWGLPASDERIELNLEALESCTDTAHRHGLELAVETIPCIKADPLTNIRRAIKRDGRCVVALDTEFLALHKQLDEAMAADWLWQGRRVHHIHVKDYDGQMFASDNRRRYLHPGEGQIDFTNFFNALKRRSFSGAISLEASAIAQDGTVDMERIRRSLGILRQLSQDSQQGSWRQEEEQIR